MVQVRIQDWWLKKNNLHCEETGKGYDSASWLAVRKETEKAYLLDEIQKYLQGKAVFVPKSCVIDSRWLPDRNKYGAYY